MKEILDLAQQCRYDFRDTANPDDPLKYLFDEWVPYYQLKWAIASYLKPRRILEIGVRFGYSGLAFLDAVPDAYYLGLDNDSEVFGGQKGAISWAGNALAGKHAELRLLDTQTVDEFPGGAFDLIHIDGQQDGAGMLHDLEIALRQASWILVDGFFWTRENFLWASEFLLRNRNSIEYYAVIPGYAGELLIKPRREALHTASRGSSADLRDTYTASYYLTDCGGYDSWKRSEGARLEDCRLQAVAEVALAWPRGRALDLGCGRGEISIALANAGFDVTGVDYSADAIELARRAFAASGSRLPVRFLCDDVNRVPLDGKYQVVVASDLIEHLAPRELDTLYARIRSHLEPGGAFIVHTFPNLWAYRYEHARRLRLARAIDAYVPADPRTRYERLMHINEQSPKVLLRQLRSHFSDVCLWFAKHDLQHPFENLTRRFSIAEMRASGDLFAIAAGTPIDLQYLRESLSMTALDVADAGRIELSVLECPVSAAGSFTVRVHLKNASGRDWKSRAPHPVHLSYHWLDTDNGRPVVYDGRRSPLQPVLSAGSSASYPVAVDPPGSRGRYVLRLSLVQEQVRWLDDPPVGVFVDRRVEVL